MDGSSSEGAPSVSVNEKGRNKRKFVSQDILVDVKTLPLTEYPRYEVLEEIANALNVMESRMERSEEEDSSIDEVAEEDQQADWDDPIACQLEELLTNNLSAILCSAVKKIVESGHTEEAAEWAVLNSSLFHGSKDAVSNVVDGALALLKREKDFSKKPKHPVFEGLQSLVDYTLLEMIYVLREVRPLLTIAEAMWCLLINDLNLVNACVPLPKGGGVLSGGCHDTKSETSTSSESDSDTLDNPKPPEISVAEKERSLALEKAKGKFSGVARDHMPLSNLMATDEKSGGGRKGPSANNTKRDLLRQKAIHFEKNYKGKMLKGAFKAKVAAWGNMVLDKSLNKSQSGSSSGVVTKGNHSKSNTTSAGAANKEPVFALPAVNSKTPKGQASAPPPPPTIPPPPHPPKTRTTDYYTSIKFDEILQKYIPKDEKEKTILMLVPHKQTLEKEIQGWTDWANEKVMQAARRLGKDQRELKLLRQEKEELEKLKKEKQTLEESTTKRLSEMGYALSNATTQINEANSTVSRLEEENSVLKKLMEEAKSKALDSATNLQEAMLREEEALKKSQTSETDKSLVLEQLTFLKRKIAELDDRLEKGKERHNQFKVLLKQEEKEKLKARAQVDFLRGKREEANALTKIQADSIKRTAETNMQKCKNNIKNLENMISEMRLESDKSKIAALSVGYSSGLPKTTKSLTVFQDNFADGDINPERECVLCMSEEIAVVFLPCSHQVLCGNCSELHEKQGMKDCPSCRITIEKRISVSYRVD